MPKGTHLGSATAAALHQIADVSWLNRCSNECINIVVVQLLQLQIQTHAHHDYPIVVTIYWSKTSVFKRLIFTLVKEALIEIGCVVTSLVVGWLVVTRVHCGQTVDHRPIVTMEH